MKDFISNFYFIRIRIDHYMSVINICLTCFNYDHALYLSEQDHSYLQKIKEGMIDLLSLFNGLDHMFVEQKITEEALATYRHDLRLAINIIQGYSEVILEGLIEEKPAFVGGNYNLIISATREILKNIDLLHS